MYILAIRSNLTDIRIFLKRTSAEVAINANNIDLLNILQSNMDIQFISSPFRCISYITDYVCKLDTGLTKMLRKVCEEAEKSGNSIRDKLFKVADVFLRGTSTGAPEATYFCMPMRSSREVIFINTHPINERTRFLKNNSELNQLDKDSNDIFKNNIFIHYSNRDKELEHVCLAVFATHYSWNVILNKKYKKQTIITIKKDNNMAINSINDLPFDPFLDELTTEQIESINDNEINQKYDSNGIPIRQKIRISQSGIKKRKIS